MSLACGIKQDEEFEKISEEIIKRVLKGVPDFPVAVELWNGKRVFNPPKVKTVIRINAPWALRKMFLKMSDLSLAEGYIYQDVDIDGDIFAMFPFIEWLSERKFSTSEKLKLAQMLLKLPTKKEYERLCAAELDGEVHSKERDKKAIEYHYDVSNEFYKCFLDKNLVYSCAYFRSYEDSLDKAQEQKIDYICRKLRLKPGEKLLDIGCGWGALVIHAAKNYGVNAVGITLSKNQAEYANERIKREGISQKCKVIVADYRDMDEWNSYDKIVSVGMFEHVGQKNALLYFEQMFKLLKERGVFLNHAISVEFREFGKPASQFIRKYVFPDGELLPIYLTIQKAEEAGFEVRDVEALREHYTLTLMHWVKRLEKNRERAVEVAGEERFRIWRLYMAASAYNFMRNKIGVYQSLLVKTAKDGTSGFPLTREDWYR